MIVLAMIASPCPLTGRKLGPGHRNFAFWTATWNGGMTGAWLLLVSPRRSAPHGHGHLLLPEVEMHHRHAARRGVVHPGHWRFSGEFQPTRAPTNERWNGSSGATSREMTWSRFFPSSHTINPSLSAIGKENLPKRLGRESLMIKGPTGCGKTRFIQHMAQELGLGLITVCCNEDTSATDLLGRHLLVGGETRWVDGPVTRAVRSGTLLYQDEVAEARADALVVIHSLSDHRRELFLDRTGETLAAPDPFMLVVSYNPGYQRSMRDMKPSTRQRFVALGFDYPSEVQEILIVGRESGADTSVVRRIVQIGRQEPNRAFVGGIA
jgi:hypothetical protein